MRAILKLTILYILISLQSCTLLQHHINVTLELPLVPDHWNATFEIEKYKLIYPDGVGSLVNVYLNHDCKSIQVKLYKSYNSFVLVYPVIDDQNTCLPPAGAIFPLHLKTGSEHTLVLSWEAGFTASMFERLWQKAVDLSAFNTPRLLSKIEEKAPADPWSLDADLIVERLAACEFSAYDVKHLAARDVFAEVPAGSWFLESPFSAVYTNESDGGLYLEEICLGFHRLFQYGSGMRFDMFVTENECVIVSP